FVPRQRQLCIRDCEQLLVRSGLTSDNFAFAGCCYKLTHKLNSIYHYCKFYNFYKHHYLVLVHTLAIADKQSLKSFIRSARSTDDGSINVDNIALNAMFTYFLGYHPFGFGYQKMSVDTCFAYIN
ncbi:OprD family outer membrane porin, partial [Pseudomonas aeruginosa]